MPDEEYIDILLHRPEVHAITPRKPMNWLRAALKMHHSGKPQRVYASLENMKLNEDGTMKVCFPLPPEMQEQIKMLEAQGKKIRFHVPEGGMPVYLSKDAKEKVASLERKKNKKKKKRR